MRLLLLTSVIFLVQCSMMELSPEEKAIRERATGIPIASSITVTELSQYKELGPLSCEQDTTYSYVNGGAEESCRSDLKLQTSRLGADLIVLESRDMAKCSFGEHLCVYMHGRAYKKIEPPK